MSGTLSGWVGGAMIKLISKIWWKKFMWKHITLLSRMSAGIYYSVTHYLSVMFSAAHVVWDSALNPWWVCMASFYRLHPEHPCGEACSRTSVRKLFGFFQTQLRRVFWLETRGLERAASGGFTARTFTNNTDTGPLHKPGLDPEFHFQVVLLLLLLLRL